MGENNIALPLSTTGKSPELATSQLLEVSDETAGRAGQR